MHISQLKLWNFRKYGSPDFDLDNPNLEVCFNEGLNLLIGENDSGKSAITDAIKLVLKAHAYEWIRAEDKDFHINSYEQISTRLRIEIHFKGIKDHEAKNFIEWLGWEEEIINGSTYKRPKLILIYDVERNNNNISPSDIKAGMDGTGHLLNATAKEYLKCTYLKPLRDAESELLARKNSRLAKILNEHSLFKNATIDHELIKTFVDANENVTKYFIDDIRDEQDLSNKKQIKDIIDEFLKGFIEDDHLSKFEVSPTDIKQILERISLGVEGKKHLGLGTLNRIFMAAELLHLRRSWDGLKLCIIEELEAHLHPQAQMKIIEKLKKESEENNIQFILTTHSPNIASKVDLKSLIICKNNDAFPMGLGYTKLEEKNYTYLRRFLEVTKSNLFFAKGVIIVEGWSEEIILPELAKKLGYDFTKQEISIVNVASTAYLHFANIFLRNDSKKMKVPIAVITDLDNKPDSKGKFKPIAEENNAFRTRKESLDNLYVNWENTFITLHLAKEWTLEWCFFKSTCLHQSFIESVHEVHSGTKEFQLKNKKKITKIFEAKFISKLKKESGTTPLDKVRIASELAQKINKSSLRKTDFENDEYIKYLVDAIKHVCDYGNN